MAIRDLAGNEERLAPKTKKEVKEFLLGKGRKATDFTGVTQIGEDQFDISGVPTNGGLPPPTLPAGGTDITSIINRFLPQGFATSTDLGDTIQQDLERQRLARRTGITQQAEELRRGETEKGLKRIEGVKAIAESAKGGVGGFSSAELSLVQQQESANNKALREIDKLEQDALLNNDIATLEQVRKERTERRQLGLQLASLTLQAFQVQSQAQLGLKQESRLKQQGEVAMETAIANLTGEFRGSPTFAATKQAIAEALAIAGLTGEFNGSPTFATQQAIIKNAFSQMGINLEAEKLAEQIRSNKVQEALASARIKQSGVSASGGLTEESLGLLVKPNEDGLYEVDPAALELLVSQKGLDRLNVATQANEVARALNAQRQVELQAQTGAASETGAFGFAPGVTIGAALGRTLKVIPSTVSELNKETLEILKRETGNFFTGLFGE